MATNIWNARTNKSLNLSFAEIEKIAEGEPNDVNRKKKDYGEKVHCILSGKASFNPDGKFRTPSGMLLSGEPNTTVWVTYEHSHVLCKGGKGKCNPDDAICTGIL